MSDYIMVLKTNQIHTKYIFCWFFTSVCGPFPHMPAVALNNKVSQISLGVVHSQRIVYLRWVCLCARMRVVRLVLCWCASSSGARAPRVHDRLTEPVAGWPFGGCYLSIHAGPSRRWLVPVHRAQRSRTRRRAAPKHTHLPPTRPNLGDDKQNRTPGYIFIAILLI